MEKTRTVYYYEAETENLKELFKIPEKEKIININIKGNKLQIRTEI